LLYLWIRRFTTIISAWWLQTFKLTVKEETEKLGNQQLIHSKYNVTVAYSCQEDKDRTNKQQSILFALCYWKLPTTVQTSSVAAGGTPLIGPKKKREKTRFQRNYAVCFQR